jgi:hypothetical protein
MKYLLSLLLAIFFAVNFSYAQNTAWPGPTDNLPVGIGTTSPSAKLDVNGTINSSSYLSSTLGYYMDITRSGMNNNAGFGYLSFRSNNVDNRMVIDPNGYVGIGTTAPAYNLAVIGAFGVGTTDFNTTTHTGSGLVIGPGATTGNTYTLFQSQMAGNSAAGSIVFNPYGGNVGIGADNPNSTLQVDDGATKANIGDASGLGLNYGTSYLGFNAARTGTSWVINTDYSNNGGGMLYSDIFGNMNFSTVNSIGGSANQILTDADMRSRIALQITRYGVVRAKEIRVETTGWADYVFKPTYKLPPLSEVKTYIDQNQHLPEIPSEQEIAKDGVNLGEMVKLQTKKIEELTLYLIEKDQENKALKENQNQQQVKLDLLKQQLEDLTKAIRKN